MDRLAYAASVSGAPNNSKPATANRRKEIRACTTFVRMETPAQYRAMRALFPFNFRKCCGCVAGVEVVEQFPSGSLGARCACPPPISASPRADEPAHVRGQRLEIAALVGEGGRPFAHRTVTGNHALRGQGAELVESRPASRGCCRPARACGPETRGHPQREFRFFHRAP